MPTETIAEPHVAAVPEKAERDYTAEEFCMAFASIYHTQRQEAADLMNVPVERITPHYSGTHYARPEHSMTVIAKVQKVMESGLCHDRVVRYAENQPDILMLHHRVLTDYLSNLSAVCFAGAAADYLLAKGTYFQSLEEKHHAKELIIKAHELFAELADGKVREAIGMDRRHLQQMARVMYGKEDSDSNMPMWFETGVSAEVATKRGLETILARRGENATIRFSTSKEDLKGSDLVVYKNGKRLLMVVKSSGRIPYEGHYVQAASHSEPEKIDNDTFYIKRLHPASTESIGQDFSIDTDYEDELEMVIEEFDELSREKKKPRRRTGATRHAWGRHRLNLAGAALRGSG
jgi:hypothetical protein